MRLIPRCYTRQDELPGEACIGASPSVAIADMRRDAGVA